MILPGKHLKQDRALLGIGGDILTILDHEQTVSELWQRFQASRYRSQHPVSFDWFILSLTFLYAIDAVTFENGILSKGADS